MNREIELLIRKTALKDLEIWLNQQYLEIDRELSQLEMSSEHTSETLSKL